MIGFDDQAQRLLRGLKLSQLRLVAEIRATGNLTAAAERLGMTQPAASRMLARIEDVIGHPIHERVGRSITLTAAGEALARRAERVVLELVDASRDVSEAAEGASGSIRVGAVTGPALSHLLPALRRMRDRFPEVSVEVVVATSDVLCEQVLGGRLDFALGRVPAALQSHFETRIIGVEPLGLLVRRGHPLLRRRDIAIGDLLALDWVMSDDETLLARTVNRWLANTGNRPPRRWVSTSSFLFTLALLQESDAVAPLAQPVIRNFTARRGMPFVQVPFEMDVAVEAYGLFRRTGSVLPPASRRLAEMMLEDPSASPAGPD
jgi:DNA-binding transcriptional LysR family regulator